MGLTSFYLFFDGMILVGGTLLLATGMLSGCATLKWWSLSYFTVAAGIATVAFGHAAWPWLGYGLGPGLNLAGFGVMWAGARRLRGRRAAPWQVLLPGVVWLAVSAVLPFGDAPWLRMVTQTLFIEAIFGLILAEILRAPVRALARLPLAGATFGHAIFVLVRAVALLFYGSPAVYRFWLYGTAIEGMLFMFCDALLISHLVRSWREHDLHDVARTDFLTGVLNRRGFTARAERCLREAPCMLLVLDIDGFKGINDTLGHGEGDRLLRELGRICVESVREGDVVGRLGGDEFAILIVGGSAEVAAAIAQRIRLGFAQTRVARGLAAAVSIGISGAGAGGATLDDLLVQADMRLYRAKDERPALGPAMLRAG